MKEGKEEGEVYKRKRGRRKGRCTNERGEGGRGGVQTKEGKEEGEVHKRKR